MVSIRTHNSVVKEEIVREARTLELISRSMSITYNDSDTDFACHFVLCVKI